MRTLVLGGIRSGKSGYAERLVRGRSPVLYVATAAARPDDAEWTARIETHRARRPADWRTLEPKPSDLPETLGDAVTDGGAACGLLIDDVGTWLTRLFDETDRWQGRGELSCSAVDSVIGRLVTVLATAGANGPRIVLVSPEVGLSVVPATAAGRAFTDALGELNQVIAATVDEVVLVVAGIPMTVKPGHHDSP